MNIILQYNYETNSKIIKTVINHKGLMLSKMSQKWTNKYYNTVLI